MKRREKETESVIKRSEKKTREYRKREMNKIEKCDKKERDAPMIQNRGRKIKERKRKKIYNYKEHNTEREIEEK
jgi:hypothetical protein